VAPSAEQRRGPAARARRAGPRLLGAALALAAVAASPAAAGAEPGPVALVAVGAPARLPRSARPGGALGARRILQVGVALRPRDPAGLAAYAAAVADPGSRLYRHFLTPAAFARRFGPTEAAVAAVTRGLRAAGLEVGRVPANRMVVPAAGSAARVEAAFHVRLERYRLPGRQEGWAATSAPLLPARWAGDVASVLGLDNLVVPHALLARPAHPPARARLAPRVGGGGPASTTPRACAAATAAARAAGGWTDTQVAAAYGLSGLFARGGLGAGQRIALYELEPFSRHDLATFERCYFGADRTSQVTTVPVDGFDLSGSGSGESILDLENLVALAPQAQVLVYEAPNTTFGALDEYNAIVSQDAANIVSTSWGQCESALQVAAPGAQQLENYLFEEAAAQGQTVFAATGDTGSDDCAGTPFASNVPVKPYLSVDDPAAQPYVVAVGGTSLSRDDPPLAGAETVWNDGANWGGTGGGISTTWPSPAWQADSGVPGVDPTANRQVPDVSASADEWRGITVYSSSFGPTPRLGADAPRRPRRSAGWTTLGGTSSATPIWAAMMADTASSPACASLSTTAAGPTLGFLAPLLYRAAALDYPGDFNDVTRGSNDVFGLGQGYSAGPGYDLATGLGSPVLTRPAGGGLADTLCALATGSSLVVPPRPTVTGLSPAYGPSGGGTAVTITGSGFPAGDPGALRVDFGAAPAQVTSVGASSVTVVAPPSTRSPSAASFAGAGPVDVTVTVLAKDAIATSAPGPAATYDYVAESGSSPVPVVTGIGPSGGNVAGGNTVDVFGAGFLVGGPVSVTFGGVPASDVHVVSDFELTATVPPESSATSCASGPGFDPATLCQVQVVVAGAGGTSPTAPILPSLSGPVVFTPAGVVDPTPETEVAPAATEYDYAPAPTITSISPNPADASGSTPVTIHGSGFAFNSFEWVNFGPPSDPSSEQLQITEISSSTIMIDPPPAASSASAEPKPLAGGVSVQSVGGRSNVVRFAYAGIPLVRRIGAYGGPTTGGTLVRITGSGLAQVRDVAFIPFDVTSPSGAATSYDVRVVSDRSITVVAPSSLPGPVDVVPCSPTGCARRNPSVDTFVYFNPASPSLAAVHPRSGPAAGGTRVALFGDNLDGAVAVRFGRNLARRLAAGSGYPDGDPYLLVVSSAPGRAGASVPIRVVTRAGRTLTSPATTFRYLPSPPSPPVGLRVAIDGDRALLRWGAPLSDGGSPITGYAVSASAPGVPVLHWRVGPGARAAVASGLSVGAAYTFSVAAVNERHGVGPAARRGPVEVRFSADGYRLATSAGEVVGFGSLPALGGLVGSPPGARVVGIAATPSGQGYWLATAGGNVYAFGDASPHGGPAVHVAGIVADADGGGYWLFSPSGAVYAYGDAPAFGGARPRPSSPVVGLAPSSGGHGCWLLGANGSVEALGSAVRLGSPVLGAGDVAAAIAATPDGKGYWVATRAGAVYAFGDARSYGSAAGVADGPVVALAATPDGRGYWLATRTGAVYAFGDARYEGRAGSSAGSVVGLATN